MGFSGNLKQIRKEKQLSQEELAELLGVSRQAVSKWEQGMGYPEAETLLLLSDKLNVSLDTLMASAFAGGSGADHAGIAGEIVIISPNEHVTAACCKVITSGKMRGGKHMPQYALFGVGRGNASFWGEPTTFLGWYADEERVSKEVEEICEAIRKGAPAHTLRYSAKTERRWAGVRMVDDGEPVV